MSDRESFQKKLANSEGKSARFFEDEQLKVLSSQFFLDFFIDFTLAN